jgi:hypothetical protein
MTLKISCEENLYKSIYNLKTKNKNWYIIPIAYTSFYIAYQILLFLIRRGTETYSR